MNLQILNRSNPEHENRREADSDQNIGSKCRLSCLRLSGIHVYLLVVISCLSSWSTYAQSLSGYLEIAIDNNPSLQASFKEYQASLEMVNQVSLENPQLNVGVFTRPMELLMGNQRVDASLMQMFPWFGMLKTQKDEATLMAEAKYEEFRQQRNQVLLEVKATYFQLIQLQNTIDITDSSLDILKTLEKLSIVRYQGGNTTEAVSSVSSAVRKTDSKRTSTGMDSMGMGGASQTTSGTQSSTRNAAGMSGMASGGGRLTDVLRIQIQIKGLESELSQLETDKKPLIAKFNQLLGREYDETVSLESNLRTEKEMGWETAFLDSVFQYNPMLLMLEKEGLAYQKQGEMAKLEGRPMFGVGLNYMVFSPRPESGMLGGMDGMEYVPSGMGNNMVMPMVSLSLPIYRKKYKSLQTASRRWWEANDRRKEDMVRSIRTEFETQMATIKDTERRIKLLAEQVALIEQTFELAVTAYATEGSTLEEILGIQQELLDYRLQEMNTVIDRELGFAKLESLIGI